jgi:uncharacterized membrane protein YkvA (DUF1232 family)
MKKQKVKRRMKEMLTFLPNMVGLCGRLMKDRRVSKTEKALFASAIVYAVAPLDFLPDLIPFIGQIDDAYLVALTLLRLINRTDERIVREHWRGRGDIVHLAESVANIAPVILPGRVSRVLSAKVELAPVMNFAKLKKDSKKLLDTAPDDERKGLIRAS